MHIRKVKVRNWIVSGLWVTLIFAISSIPASPLIKIYTQLRSSVLRFLLSDPVGHVVMFGILGVLLARSFWKNFPLMGRRNLILWTFLVSFLLALANEVYQRLITPGRAFEIEDIIWDFVGIGVATSYIFITLPKTMRKSHSTSWFKTK